MVSWIAILLPLVGLAVVGAVFCIVKTLRGLKRPQFTLRTLLLYVAAMAVALSAVGSWRYLNRAQAKWLEPSSGEAEAIEVEPVLTRQDDRYATSYRSRFRNIGRLFAETDRRMDQTGGDLSTTTDPFRGWIKLETDDPALLEAWLGALREADQPEAGWMVIRGLVVDSEGRGVPDATIDLMGPYVYINHFQTRQDGTFTMPIEAPPGFGYHLRVRPDSAAAQRTGMFSLRPDKRELVVKIRLR